jgi:hypothetical protein
MIGTALVAISALLIALVGSLLLGPTKEDGWNTRRRRS